MPDSRIPMAAPSVRYHDLPITTYAGWDKVAAIEGLLIQHDYGQLRQSAMFCDSLMRDDRINAVVETRVGALMAAPIECTPGADGDLAARYSEEVGGTDSRPGRWTEMCPQAVLSGLTFWGLMAGIGVAEIIWRTDDSPTSWVRVAKNTDYSRKRKFRWTPRLKLWHPQFLYYNWATFQWMLICQEGVVPLPNTDEQPHGDGKWLIWTPRGYQYGWLRSLLRPLAYKYLMRGWNYRDWARYNERHGQPIIGAITPAGLQDEDVKDDFVQSVRQGASDGVVEIPQAGSNGDMQDGGGFDVKLIEAKARSFDSFDKFKTQLDTDTAIVVLGQNLTTEGGQKGGGGSRALGQVQENVRLDKRREDSALASAIRDQMLYWDAIFNYGDPEVAPRPAFQVEPPEDETQKGTAMKAVGDGLASLAAVSKGRLDVITLLEEEGFPLLTEEEVAAQKAADLEEQVTRQQALAPPPTTPGGPAGGAGGAGPASGGAAGAPQKKALRAGEASLPSTVVSRRTFQGLPIAIENAAGTLRAWTDGDTSGTTKMLNDYGFVEGVTGNDGEELDVYLGPDEAAPDVHVVHQRRAPWGESDYDEDKTFLGFPDAGAAKAAFLAHRDDGERAFGGMSTIPLPMFKRKLRTREGTGKIRAGAAPDAAARRDTTLALEALVARLGDGPRAMALRAGGKKRARRWPDRLEENSVRIAARVLAPDVAGIRAQLEKAKSWDEARELIVDYYRDSMTPDQLAEVVRRMNVLAHAGGRLTAKKQI